jgi:hypothetical protein
VFADGADTSRARVKPPMGCNANEDLEILFSPLSGGLAVLQQVLMPYNKLKRSSDWRCRREEYLRASGRREDLICEGYESPGTVAKLAVIPGGGRRSPSESLRTGLFIVKRGVS